MVDRTRFPGAPHAWEWLAWAGGGVLVCAVGLACRAPLTLLGGILSIVLLPLIALVCCRDWRAAPPSRARATGIACVVGVVVLASVVVPAIRDHGRPATILLSAPSPAGGSTAIVEEVEVPDWLEDEPESRYYLRFDPARPFRLVGVGRELKHRPGPSDEFVERQFLGLLRPLDGRLAREPARVEWGEGGLSVHSDDALIAEIRFP